MHEQVAHKIDQLERMTHSQLAARFEEVFGEPCRSRNRRYLIRRIAWRLQADAEGGLSQRARRRAAALANLADARVTPPRNGPAPASTSAATIKLPPGRDSRLPPPGSWLERSYKGRIVRVFVGDDSFEYDGCRYRSLSAVAKAVTGSHINGFVFFKLGGRS